MASVEATGNTLRILDTGFFISATDTRILLCFFTAPLEGRGGDLRHMCKTKKGTGLYTYQHSSFRFVWVEG